MSGQICALVSLTNPRISPGPCYKANGLGRTGHVRSLLTPILVAPLLLGSLPAFAQGNPSASQIINSLRPSGNLVSGGTRGIRIAAPPSDAAATPAPSPAQQPRVASSKPVAVPVAAAAQAAPTSG